MAAASLWHYDERAMRRLGMLYHLLAFALLYGGVRWLAPGAEGRVAALLAGCLYLFSPTAVRTAGAVMPHSLFVLLSLAAVLLLGKLRETGRLACWWCAVAVAGLALCTLEVGLVLVATLAACCWLERKAYSRLGSAAVGALSGAIGRGPGGDGPAGVAGGAVEAIPAQKPACSWLT